MKLLFFDETSDHDHPDYLGVCGAIIDSTKYGKIKREFHAHMNEFKWDPSIEFKGSWIFSASKGCQTVPVIQRVDLAKSIIAMNSSGSNSAIKFCYIYGTLGSQREQYLAILRLVGDALMPKCGTTKQGKDIFAIYCDQRSDVSLADLKGVFRPIIASKNATLLEDIHRVQSNMETVGLCYADIVGYLMSRVDNIKVDAGLFEELNTEEAQRNGQLRKFITSTAITRSIKSMQVYKAIRKGG